MDVNSVDWKEAREYSFQLLQLLINASESEEALKHLEHDIDALNNNYSSNVYLAGMQYTFEDVDIFRIGEDSERNKKLSELFNNISDLLKDNEESLIPPIEIFEPMNGNIDDFKVSNDFNNTNETTNEGETMNTNNQTNNQTNQEATKQQVLTKTSTWCKVVGGLAVTTAIGAAGYYAYKKFFGNNEEA